MSDEIQQPNQNPQNPTTPVIPQDKVLIVKHDKRKQKMNVKLRKRMTKGFSPDEYVNSFNPKDYNMLAQFFDDLQYVIGAPVEKAFWKHKKDKGEGFPFY